ncbi:MAG: TolC family protein [Deltaproteobacteria bacterium]|nr:TolC family protein [Deltaproteobacteria bacterium]
MKPYIFVLIFVLLAAGGAQGSEQPAAAARDLSGIKVLDLATAQDIALKDNPSMAAAMARVRQARARVRQAAAAWWPSLDLTGSGSHVRLPDSSLPSPAVPYPQSYDEYTAGIQAAWVLFDGFYRSFSRQQASFGEKSARDARRDARRLLVSSVARAFLNAQLARTKVRIARADKDFYGQQLRDAENRYKVGTGAWGDVLNIKVQINSAKTSLMLAAREFEAAGYGLAALMGLPGAVLPPGIDLAPLDRNIDTGGHEENPEPLIAEALARRPDVRRLEMQLHESKAATGAAKAPFYPKLQLAGAVNGVRLGDAALNSDDFGNTVSLRMAWNLFAGGADRARLFEARQKQREIGLTLADLRNQVAAEIRQDIARLAAAREQVRLQRDSVKLVEENRDLAKNEYEAGETSLVRLNEAQRDLTTTHSRLAQALVAFHLARQNLLAATGRNLARFEKH